MKNSILDQVEDVICKKFTSENQTSSRLCKEKWCMLLTI